MANLSIDQNHISQTDSANVTVEIDDSVILRCNQTLKLESAIEILNNTDQYKVINKVPENPKGGDTFLLIPHPGDEGTQIQLCGLVYFLSF